MEIIDQFFEGCFLFEARKFKDFRGSFTETFNQKNFNSLVNEKITFVQDNLSISSKYVFRGIHYQKEPNPQGKLVSVLNGSVFDVICDLRIGSETFGNHKIILLTGNDEKYIWIPKGFGHGFLSMEENTLFSYKVNNYYDPQSDRSINYQDPQIDIDFKDLIGCSQDLLLSEKDKDAPMLDEINPEDLFKID
jgi:dTDP-4-dehydrorhamnose 3,5-epimerase